MKRWQNEKDLPGFDNEEIISKNMSADDTVKMILKDCTKNYSFVVCDVVCKIELWYNFYIKGFTNSCKVWYGDLRTVW